MLECTRESLLYAHGIKDELLRCTMLVEGVFLMVLLLTSDVVVQVIGLRGSCRLRLADLFTLLL